MPVNDIEINQRGEDYNHLNIVQFSRKYGRFLYEPVDININGASYSIQANYCINPFCKWYGLGQHKYTDLKRSPSRYTIIGREISKVIKCNSVNDDSIDKPVILSYTTPLSNWGLVEEIKRLIDVNSIENIEPEYIFHKEGCSKAELNPFDNQSDFYKRGKSSSNSQKY